MVLSIDLILLVFTILTGLFVMIRHKPPIYLRILTIALATNFVVDTIGTILVLRGKQTNGIYNIYNLVTFEFYLVVLYHILKSSRVKKVLFNVLVGFPVLWVINLFFIQGFEEFQSITYSLGCLLVVSFSIYYFLELFQRPTSVRLVLEPAFWVTSSLLFYYCCIFPIAGFLNLVGNLSDRMVNIYQAVIVVINVFMYSLFLIAFVCLMKIRKYTP